MLQHETIFTCLSPGHIGKTLYFCKVFIFLQLGKSLTISYPYGDEINLSCLWPCLLAVLVLLWLWGGLCSKKLVFVGLHERPRDIAFHVIWLCGRILCTHCGGYCLRSSGSRTTYAHTETSDLSRCRSHVAQNYSHFDISEVYLHKSCHLFLGVDIWIANVYPKSFVCLHVRNLWKDCNTYLLLFFPVQENILTALFF